ncbi:MAG: hypothetical protein FJW34_10145 [Acidobacteria bacterium]|nr:hypothetical protein [Acidobacteriota bacterium]
MVFVAAGLAQAAGTVTWEMNSWRDFVSGRFSHISLARDGRLLLAPKLETLFSSDQPVIWTLVEGPGGILYSGTGHRGRVFRIEPSGKPSVLWTAEQPEVFALAVDSKGALYAGTSPDGKVYRIESGKASEYFAPKAKYIWALRFGQDGALYVGTGDEGKVFRVTGAGQGEVYYETGQTHVTCLAVDAAGRLLAGTEPNGILYRVSRKDQAYVLYDANLPEIRAIVPAPDGAIYAVALGGSMSRPTLGGVPSVLGVPSSVSVSATSTSITVTGEAAQGGVEIKPKAEAAKPAAAPAAAAAAPVLDISGVEKSAVYRIDTDNTVETLWSSKEENIYDLLLSGGQLVFSTDGKGRLYRLSADRKAALLAQTNEGAAIRLLATSRGVLAATGDLGRIYRLADEVAEAGAYESPVHDAGTVARWGRLNWRGENLERSRVVFHTRSGNSSRPDKTWSEWSEPLADPRGTPVRSPNARYLQWKAEFRGGQGAGPVLDAVTLAYLPQNTPPVVRSINVTTQLAGTAPAKPAAQSAAATYSITVTDTGESAPSTSSGTPTQALARPASEQVQITWQAEDPDGDRLLYTLHFRGEDEREWKLLKAHLTENTFALESNALADGRYSFRVTATDGAVNPPGAAREAELISAPVLIDHTPPTVRPGTPVRASGRVEIEFEASDAASGLRRAEYSLDAGPWTPVAAQDGIIDSPQERFTVRLENLAPGEHLLVLRVFDAGNNAGLARVVLR